MESQCNLKIIDLSKTESEIIKNLSEACFNHGFFHLINHGIDSKLISSLFEQTKLLFQLPTEEKAKIDKKNSSVFRGYTDFNNETLNPKVQTQPDTKEGFYAAKHVDETSPEYGKDTFQGPNQYPNKELLPHFREVVDKYYEEMLKLCTGFLKYMAVVLKISLSDLQAKFNNPVALVRLLHYNERKSDIQKGIMACGDHSDYGLMTFLLTDGVPGLEVLIDGQWIEVEHVEGAFVVNLADMLERFSNGKVRSTKHRVINKLGKERYSIPFFYEPNSSTVVEPLNSFVDEKNPAKYPPVKYEDYIRMKYKESLVEFK
jgi:isopenicillin N synthase-like dioxygenase